MTLLDLCRLIKRYWVLVVALPVVCVVVCGAVLFMGGSFESEEAETATARIVVNSQVAAVSGIASSEVRQEKADNPEITSASAKADTATMTVTVTVKGPNGEENVKVANDIAKRTLASAEDFYAESYNKENTVAFKGQLELAKTSKASTASAMADSLKYLAIALLAGLFVAVCIVVIIDMVRRPVKSIEGVQEAVELPVLEKLPVADGGDRLLANVRFASKKDEIANIVVIPTSQDAGAKEAAEALEAAAKVEGTDLDVVRCKSLSEGMDGAYAAQKADAVVLTVHQWSDSMKVLESVVAELKLADANLVGLVFGEEVKK